MAEVPIPLRLDARPRAANGFPIPYLVVIVDGRPDFRISDPDKWLECNLHKLCALCGQPLKKRGWFVGGPLCHENRIFLDPPMHRDCAEYALKVCPYLAMPRGHFSNVEKRPAPLPITVSQMVAPERPERFMLACTDEWKLAVGNNDPFIVASPWTEVHWYRHGEEIQP